MEVDRGAKSGPQVNRITTGTAAPSKTRSAINYILGGPSEEQYQLKRQQRKILRAAMVKAQVNAIHTGGSHEETKPIDGPILVLTLCISCFDVHKVLVDPGSKADLLQLPAFNQIKLSSRMLNLAEKSSLVSMAQKPRHWETLRSLYKQNQSPNKFCSQSSKTWGLTMS